MLDVMTSDIMLEVVFLGCLFKLLKPPVYSYLADFQIVWEEKPQR